MELTFEHRFAAPVDRVLAMYASEDFSRERALATGAIDTDVTIDGAPADGFSVTIRRTMPTESIDANARQFVGPSVTVRYSEAWEADGGTDRRGTFAVEVVGVPARASGDLALTPDGAACTLTIAGTVGSSMPLFAAMVTEAVTRALKAGLEQEIAAADAWLARA